MDQVCNNVGEDYTGYEFQETGMVGSSLQQMGRWGRVAFCLVGRQSCKQKPPLPPKWWLYLTHQQSTEGALEGTLLILPGDTMESPQVQVTTVFLFQRCPNGA